MARVPSCVACHVYRSMSVQPDDAWKQSGTAKFGRTIAIAWCGGHTQFPSPARQKAVSAEHRERGARLQRSTRTAANLGPVSDDSTDNQEH